MRGPLRIGLVDDHTLFRDGLRRLLEREPDLVVEWERPNSTGLDWLLSNHPVDLLLMDLQLGAAEDGLEATGRIKQRWPVVKVIVVSASLDPESGVRALAAGASAFLTKDVSAVQLLARIRAIAAEAGGGRGERRKARVELSRREQQVLEEIRRGQTNREIAVTLGVSTTTVNKHVQSVLRKLQVRNRAQAAVKVDASGRAPAPGAGSAGS
jgi:DNA-binding NarL/FixJ family response regulator